MARSGEGTLERQVEKDRRGSDSEEGFGPLGVSAGRKLREFGKEMEAV
ncbi:MAG: hypothetical protein ACOYI4_06245 [Christensenellales bacterium]